jgi:hypothetical protein
LTTGSASSIRSPDLAPFVVGFSDTTVPVIEGS